MARLLSLFVLTVLTLLASSTLAKVPVTTQVEGLLTTTGGGPAADGTYPLMFKLYSAESGGEAAWTEGPINVDVKSGQFAYALGTKTPLSATLLAGLPEAWLGLQVASEPELGRKALQSVPYALRAAVSEGIDCSGCVTLQQLGADVTQAFAKTADLSKVAKSGAYADLSGTPDLSAYAKSADLSAYAKSASLAAVAMSGGYLDLDGLPTLPKVGMACGTGLVMKGIKADGSYDCVSAAFTAADLPKDGLDEISNGLLYNQFDEVAVNTTVVDIPDNNPVGISSVIDVPDFGTAQALTISAEVANSDTTNLVINAIDPTGTKFVLWSKSAKGTAVKTTWPTLTKTVSGDLTTWVGKNAKGKWYLEVIDTAFLNNAKDGQLKSWSVNIQVLASAKVGVNGALKLKNADVPPVTCDVSTAGSIYFDIKTQAIRYCAGGVWKSISDTCGNGILDPSEECDDGNNTNGDGCSATCTSVCGDGKLVGKEECDDGNAANGDGCSSTCIAALGFIKTRPGTSCANVLAVAKVEGTTVKDGAYWIDTNGGAATDAFQAWCDMTADGGGWTLAMRMKNDSGLAYDAAAWTDTKAFNDEAAGSLVPTVNANAKFATFNTLPATQVRGCKGTSPCTVFTYAGSAKALQSVMGGAFVGSGPSRATMVSLIGYDDGSQPYCNVSGLNNAATSGGGGSYSFARFGLVGNNENDCATTDSAWGWGVYSAAGQCGAGMAGWQAATQCVQGTLWVR
jgi:cysteine-rich repeat protein